MPTVEPGSPPGAPTAPCARRSRTHPARRDFVVVDRNGNVVDGDLDHRGHLRLGARWSTATMLNNELTDFRPRAARRTASRSPTASKAASGRAARWRRRSSTAPTARCGSPSARRAARPSRCRCQGAHRRDRLASAASQDAIALAAALRAGRHASTSSRARMLEAMIPALQALGEHVRVVAAWAKANGVERGRRQLGRRGRSAQRRRGDGHERASSRHQRRANELNGAPNEGGAPRAA